MANDVNSATISGRLGKDPELRYTGSGRAVIKVQLAVSRSWKKDGSDEWQQETHWITVSAWGKQAEKIGSAAKGDLVFVAGPLKVEKWEKDGKQNSTTVVDAKSVMIERKGGKGSEALKQPETQTSFDPDAGDDDIPF